MGALGLGLWVGKNRSNNIADPYAITNVVITPITGGNRITFTSIAGRQTEIWASIDGGAYALLTTLNIGVETYDHTGLYAEIVDYKLRSKLIELDVPLNLTSDIITGTGVELNWDDNNTDATHIEIYANIDGAGYVLIDTVEDGVETYTHTIQDATVIYKIRAKNTEFFSGYSDTTTEDVPLFYDTDALALVARMTALGETPDAARIQILSDAFALGKTKSF